MGMHDVAVYLRTLREEHPDSPSQEKAGALIGVNRRTVERWEAGDHEPPLTRLRDYVVALGGSIDHVVDLLLGRKEQPPEPSGVVMARATFASLPPDVIEALAPAADALLKRREPPSP